MTVTDYVNSVDTDPQSFLPENKFSMQVRQGAFNEEQLQRLVAAKYRALFAELAAHGLLIARHPHPVPAGLFSFTVHWLAESYDRLPVAGRSLG
ncbi:hypothetical protein SMC26_14435 [Actinomadura fulvescens]|uniref:Uncharacterized protein n=1 Tax=Actinomadura fulvescens TaxID=46160 RepID=A0ABN3Q1T5_9ACTN